MQRYGVPVNPITDAILLREALSTTRMALPDLSDLYHTKGNCPIHDGEHVTDRNPTEDAGTHYYMPVPTPESLTAWAQKYEMSRETMAYRLGVPVTYVDDLLSGKVILGDNVSFAMGKLIGMTVNATAEEVERTVQHDNAPAAKDDPVKEAAKPLIDRLGVYDAERVRQGVEAAKDGTFQGVKFPEVDQELEGR